MYKPIGIHPSQEIFIERVGSRIIMYLHINDFHPQILNMEFNDFSTFHIVALEGETLRKEKL